MKAKIKSFDERRGKTTTIVSTRGVDAFTGFALCHVAQASWVMDLIIDSISASYGIDGAWIK